MCVCVWRVAFKVEVAVCLVLIFRQLPDECLLNVLWLLRSSESPVCVWVCVRTGMDSHTDEHNTPTLTAKLSKLDQLLHKTHTTHSDWYWLNSINIAANGWHSAFKWRDMVQRVRSCVTQNRGQVWLRDTRMGHYCTVTLNWPMAKWTSTWESKVFSGNKSLPFGITFKLAVMSGQEDKIILVTNQCFLCNSLFIFCIFKLL